jgi:hypothetical protein
MRMGKKGSIGILIFILFSSMVSYSQKIVDTTGMYNGETTKKRIEFSRAGELTKETYYFPNGRIEQENLYQEGVPYYWISFDQHGNKTAEWGDPENSLVKWRKGRLWVLSLTIVCFAGLTVAAARRNYENTFYIFLTLSLFIPFLIMLLEKQRSLADGNRNFHLILSSLIFLIPGSLFILSLISLSKRIKIPWSISILAILISLVFLLFFAMVSNIAGAGILG